MSTAKVVKQPNTINTSHVKGNRKCHPDSNEVMSMPSKNKTDVTSAKYANARREEQINKSIDAGKVVSGKKAEAAGSKNVKSQGGAFVDLKTQAERKALLTAVYNEKDEEVKRMVRKEGYNTNFTDEEDPKLSTPLIIATEKANLNIVRYLLRAKPYPAKVNAENKDKQRAIWMAVCQGNAELTEVLISQSKDKCDVNYIDKQTGMTPFYRAILSKSTEVCRKLLHAGADINMRRLGLHGNNSEGETPLIKAVQLNSLGICEILVNALVDLNAKTSSGLTALHYAVANRRYIIARYLLEERAKVQVRSKNGTTPMTIAISEHLPAIVWILIEYGYNVDKRFQWGETPLEMAIRTHSTECAMVLLRWGCRLTLKDKKKPSYFTMACVEGLTPVIKLLVDLNPSFLQVEWLRNNKQLPLALYKQPELCEWLQEESENVRSLSQLCNAKIVRYLGKYCFKKLDKLPLPDKLKEPMKFNKYFTGKIVERKYREKSLFTKECPFDCDSNCKRPQCPEIEFSDSGSEFEGYTDSDSDENDRNEQSHNNT